MDHDFGTVDSQQLGDAIRCIEVERGSIPGGRPGWTSERRVGQRCDERPAEASAGAGHRDSHQSSVAVDTVAVAVGTTGAADAVGAVAAAAWPVASR